MDAVPGMLEYTVARAVSSAVLPRFSDRKRGRGPVFAATLVPDINRFRGRIGNRIVRPTRQAVALTVFIPGKTRSRFRNQGAEARIGNYVRPRGRCVLVGAELNNILFTPGGEAPHSVEVGQLDRLQLSREQQFGLARRKLLWKVLFRHDSRQLLRQRTARGAQ